jgi:DNA-binding LytR/AlgR family response regulator
MKEKGCNDNNLDELLECAFQKETEGLEAPDGLKEKIDEEICEKQHQMNIIVCDNNEKDRKILTDLLRDYERDNNLRFKIKEYISGRELCNNIDTLYNCKLIFLGINTSDNDGLKTAEDIRKYFPQNLIVLVSAYLNHALDGYKVKASRFLLKGDLSNSINECMDDLIAEIQENNRIMEFPFVEGSMKLYVDEIIYVETDGHKNLFHIGSKTYNIYKKLDELTTQLQDYGFVRIHKSYLVNMRYILKISSYVVTLQNGKKLSVPRSRYQEVKRQFTLYKRA